MSKLDLKDRKILYELDLNARQSDSDIAKHVRLSREATRYRIANLVAGGYINYFMTIVNTMKLGFEWYRTFFKFQNLDAKTEQDIIVWLSDRVSWVVKVEGRWDLNTGVFVRNAYEYRDFINQFLLQFRNYIADYEVSIVTRMWHYHRDYLLDRSSKDINFDRMGFDEGTDYTPIEIDRAEYDYSRRCSRTRE